MAGANANALEFYEKLKVPARSTETMVKYLLMSKSKQDDRKDIGGFVTGSLSGHRRKSCAITGRDIITLDFYNVSHGGTEDVLKRVKTLGCGYCVYSTRKHIHGKSTILDKMSKGWFNDSIRTFEGKEARELLQCVWFVEIGELDAFRKKDVARIKQFLSQRSDRFREAYGRHVKEMPRRCVFFGMMNSDEYLRDKTGNRRF